MNASTVIKCTMNECIASDTGPLCDTLEFAFKMKGAALLSHHFLTLASYSGTYDPGGMPFRAYEWRNCSW